MGFVKLVAFLALWSICFLRPCLLTHKCLVFGSAEYPLHQLKSEETAGVQPFRKQDSSELELVVRPSLKQNIFLHLKLCWCCFWRLLWRQSSPKPAVTTPFTVSLSPRYVLVGSLVLCPV